MRLIRSFLFGVAVLMSTSTVYAKADPLLKFDGKPVTVDQLPPADQQHLYEAQAEAYQRSLQVIDQAALNLYFNEQAKKSGKKREDVEGQELQVGEPGDQDVKDWYEQNKQRIPPGLTLEKISGDIKGLLREQGKKEKRDALVKKLKADGRYSVLLAEPTAPVVAFDLAGFPALGPENAPVTLVEFADYQCPHCKAATPILSQAVKKFPNKVRLVFLDFPIKGPTSERAAEAAFCAGQQSKFWEFHDLAFERQGTLGQGDESLMALAKELKLDEGKLKACLSTEAPKKQVARGKAAGEHAGVSGTPAIYINGRHVRGYEGGELEKAIEGQLKSGRS